MTKVSEWKEAQEWERDWHDSCVNSYNEETKQLVYARKMGLQLMPTHKTPYNFSTNGQSILDIGGGAYSLLLKCYGFSYALVVDPCKYPKWVYQRYLAADIETMQVMGEKLELDDIWIFDEAWIYNVLQHVLSPAKVIENALKYSKIVRVFEWIENGVSAGHPHNLTEKDLNEWLAGYGKVEQIDESGCRGLCYYGIFKGKHYGK